jgi:hypothetical protein
MSWTVASYCHLSDELGLLRISRDDTFNPYIPFRKGEIGFQDRRVRPLCHLSNALDDESATDSRGLQMNFPEAARPFSSRTKTKAAEVLTEPPPPAVRPTNL